MAWVSIQRMNDNVLAGGLPEQRRKLLLVLKHRFLARIVGVNLDENDGDPLLLEKAEQSISVCLRQP